MIQNTDIYRCYSVNLMQFLSQNGLLIGVFAGCVDLENKSLELFGRQFNKSVIAKACNGDINTAYGYEMKYIDKDKFNTLTNGDVFLLIEGGDCFEITI